MGQACLFQIPLVYWVRAALGYPLGTGVCDFVPLHSLISWGPPNGNLSVGTLPTLLAPGRVRVVVWPCMTWDLSPSLD